MLPHFPFPSIESFHNVVRYFDQKVIPESQESGKLINTVITYRGKVKLHGCNVGINIFNGEVVPQSRSHTLSANDDHFSFAKWVEANKVYWASLSMAVPITIFGEWCGQGIQQSTAISQIGKKVFAVFAIAVHPDAEGKSANLISEPTVINYILCNDILSHDIGSCPDVHVLPWFGEEFKVDYSKKGELQAIADKLSNVVNEIEPCDPWVKATFGVEGAAEGVVYYPGAGLPQPVVDFAELSFKAKGEKHKVVATKQVVQVSAEVAKSVDDFVAMFVTEPRLEQGMGIVGKDMKAVGQFLKWLSSDVQKESVAELEASGLKWDDVQKAVQTAARTWFLNKNKAI